MAKWLFKTEPTDYSFEDLVRDKKTRWEGVKNPTALIHLRKMKAGDKALVYHTGKIKAVVGLAKIVRGPYADPAKNDPKLVVVDLAPVKPVKKEVPLSDIKAKPMFKEFDLVRIGRLSVMPVPTRMWSELLRMAGTSGS